MFRELGILPSSLFLRRKLKMNLKINNFINISLNGIILLSVFVLVYQNRELKEHQIECVKELHKMEETNNKIKKILERN